MVASWPGRTEGVSTSVIVAGFDVAALFEV